MVSTAAAVQPRNVQRRRGPAERVCSVRVFTRSLAGVRSELSGRAGDGSETQPPARRSNSES